MDEHVRDCGDHEGRIKVFPDSAISDINAHPLLLLNKMTPCRALDPGQPPTLHSLCCLCWPVVTNTPEELRFRLLLQIEAIDGVCCLVLAPGRGPPLIWGVIRLGNNFAVPRGLKVHI